MPPAQLPFLTLKSKLLRKKTAPKKTSRVLMKGPKPSPGSPLSPSWDRKKPAPAAGHPRVPLVVEGLPQLLHEKFGRLASGEIRAEEPPRRLVLSLFFLHGAFFWGGCFFLLLLLLSSFSPWGICFFFGGEEGKKTMGDMEKSVFFLFFYPFHLEPMLPAPEHGGTLDGEPFRPTGT